MRTILLLSSLLLSINSFSQKVNSLIDFPNQSQSYIIRGQVYDSSLNFGLGDATIVINNKKKGFKADRNGYFELKLPKKYLNKNFSLRITFHGYITATIKIENKKELFNKELRVYLHSEPPSNKVVG